MVGSAGRLCHRRISSGYVGVEVVFDNAGAKAIDVFVRFRHCEGDMRGRYSDCISVSVVSFGDVLVSLSSERARKYPEGCYCSERMCIWKSAEMVRVSEIVVDGASENRNHRYREQNEDEIHCCFME